MKTIRLSVENIHSVRALHIYLAYMMNWPAYYGKNLDALHDMLCEERESIHIVLCGAAASEEMAAYLPRLVHVMEDSARENPCIQFEQI